ncbi:hypothetical protein Ddye_010612 [Dipteronia dyeriana]|uniref:Cytochrome P450 n=1 Tax=Dipteronia dyeriana TaxID=168575 RepID=A0AAD9XDX7_9ROSI|nr:hypothetical protein Ddye_010612 [Dipteronia dyeriana]
MEFSLLYSSLSLLIFIIAFKFLLQTVSSKHKNHPPSPRALPILGHLHLLKEPLHRTLQALSEKYGSVFSLRFGSRNVIVVSSSSTAEECLNKNDIVFANRPRLIMGKYLGYNNTTIALSPYGDHWRNLRRLSAVEIFSTSRLNMFLGIRRDEISILLEKLYGVSRNGTGFAKVELRPMFTELTFNIIMRMVAGKRYYGGEDDGEEAREFQELIKEMFEYGGASNPADFLPILEWFDYQGLVKRALSIGEKTDSFLQGLIDEHLNAAADESRNTMISHLLVLRQSQPDYYTDEIIKGLIIVMLLAATDTSAVTLEWAMSNMLNHPEVLNKARAEIESLLDPNQLIDESDLSKLHYLHNIISETLRLYPAAPLLLPHLSSDDCTVEGYDIPRDTILFINAWAIQRDPKYWDAPTSFKPERFESGEPTGFKLLPFGLGRRACPGVGLAQRVVGLTLGSLIQCFDWERIDGKEVDMSEGKGLTMPKAVPLEAMCKARPILNKRS